MRIHLLLQNGMRPIPNNIEVVADWGNFMMVEGDGFVMGEHLLLEGRVEDFRNWLGQFIAVWIGKGQPAEQEFELMIVRRNDDTANEHRAS